MADFFNHLLSLHVADGKTLGEMLTVGFLTSVLGKVVGAIVIILLGFWVAGFVSRRIRVLAERHQRLDATLFAFFGNLARYAILTITALLLLNTVGIQTTSLVAVVGAAGLAVGLALQGTLSSIAAGVMIILFRPFKLGDYIKVDSVAGSVIDINLNFIELKTYDGLQIVVPNAKVWGNVMTNYSAYQTRMCEWTFGVGYGSDLHVADRVIRETITSDPRMLAEPKFFLMVTNLGDSSVDFLCRCWTKSSDFWVFKNDMIWQVKEALDAAGVEIPFPNRTVWLNHVLPEGDRAGEDKPGNAEAEEAYSEAARKAAE